MQVLQTHTSNIYSLLNGYKLVTMHLSSRDKYKNRRFRKMFFLTCNTECNSDCSSIWQILSRMCGIGCC